MKLKHLLPIYSFINYLTNICYTPAKALGTMRDCISQGPKSKQMAHSNQDNPKGVYLQKGFVAKVWIRRNCAGTQGQHQHSCHHPWVLKGPEEERAKEAAGDRLARSRGPHREGARGPNILLSLSHRPLISTWGSPPPEPGGLSACGQSPYPRASGSQSRGEQRRSGGADSEKQVRKLLSSQSLLSFQKVDMFTCNNKSLECYQARTNQGQISSWGSRKCRAVAMTVS